MKHIGKVLVTGATGYIGSHTTLALLQSGFKVLLLDNLCNSSLESVERVAKLAGREAIYVTELFWTRYFFITK